MTTTPRYLLKGFVCDGPCTRPSDDLGWSRVAQIFVRRPDKCRYAVVENLTGQFEAWDFYLDGWPPPGDPDAAPTIAVHSDLDAAWMATTLGYKQP